MQGERQRPWSNSYAEGVPHDIDEVTGTLVDLVAEAVAAYGPQAALEFFGRETTYAQLGDQVARAAEGLRRLGVRAGDRVAILLPNCPQHVVAFHAILRLGAVVVEHNPLYTGAELKHLFADHRAKVAVAWDKLGERLGDLPAELRFDRVVSVDVTREMPLRTRATLRLPVKRAQDARAALTAQASAGATRPASTHGDVTWRELLRSPPWTRRTPPPIWTTSPCCSTRAARPEFRRARS